ncbi:Astacin (Peptidase M12A) [Parelaphostrongylus tenuis]|uniref:Astacin (Peptidase M12A) n=1 Tax=Parelaphostrongylus tenuis TaxID=148309 RepID=A0AAD5R7T2_PARTN|nr:Astacin (Peptidase M12A) [Parelaphostrongylus tenuis]
MEDIKLSGSNRKKRQAYVDYRYPQRLWTNNQVYYTFAPNASEKAKRVFKKATQIWSSVTCLNFTESSTATDRIHLILSSGCWSHLGRIGGVQYMSLGRGSSGGPDVSETTPALTSGPTSRLTSPKSSCKDKNM